MPIKGQRFFAPLPSGRPGRKTSRSYALIVAKIRAQRGPFTWRSAGLPHHKLMAQLVRNGELMVVRKNRPGRHGTPAIYRPHAIDPSDIPPTTRTDLL